MKTVWNSIAYMSSVLTPREKTSQHAAFEQQGQEADHPARANSCARAEPDSGSSTDYKLH